MCLYLEGRVFVYEVLRHGTQNELSLTGNWECVPVFLFVGCITSSKQL